MTREVQKADEIRLVEQLRRRLGGVPDGTVESTFEPDVCVTSCEHRIGIEVTEIHQIAKSRRDPSRIQESERSGVVRRACALAAEQGVPVLDVAVYFNEAVPIAKRDREVIARVLVDLVLAHTPEMEQSATIDTWRRGDNPLPWVRTVRLFRTNVMTRHHWWAAESGWVQTDFSLELQDAIAEKNSKYTRYIQHCDECWLLVVASGGRPSGLFEPSEETRGCVYRSLFTRTFFMEALTGIVVELRTTAA